MPYEHKKTGKNEVTVTKADSGKVVGHTSPGKLNSYLAALHIHSGDNAAEGGVVEIPKSEFISEHERLLPKLSGKEKQEQEKELMNVRGYAKGGVVSPYPNYAQGGVVGPYPDYTQKLKDHLTERYAPKEVSYKPPMMNQMAKGGIVSPYPSNRQMIEETNEQRHPEAEDREFMAKGGMVPHMALGDIVMPKDDSTDPFNVGVSQSTSTTPSFDPSAGLPPSSGVVAPPPAAPVAPPVAPRQAPSMATPTMPQDSGIADYLASQKEQLSKYGPEQQLALARDIAQRERGLGPNLARAGGTFADALMQGVARAGNPGFGASIENEQNRRGEQELGAFQKAGEQSLQQISAQEKLDAMNPTSSLSKAAQQSYGPLLQKMGFKPEMISGMSASNIGDLTGKSVEAMKAETEGKLAMATMGFKTQEAEKQRRDQIIAAAKDVYDKTSEFNPLTRDEHLRAQAVLEKAARGEDVTGGAGSGKPIYIQNPKTGHRMVSTDGGNTWGDVK